MNLDRLKALIRLANNNPSDHEANTAARKVCQILAENNFSILNQQPLRTAAEKMRQHAANYSNGPTTWNDVKRSTEPNFRSGSWRGFDWSKAPHVDRQDEPPWWEDFQRKYTNREKDFVSWDTETRQNPNIKYDAQGKRIREQAVRKCSKCGVEIMTFRTKEDPWICNPCHWKEPI